MTDRTRGKRRSRVDKERLKNGRESKKDREGKRKRNNRDIKESREGERKLNNRDIKDINSKEGREGDKGEGDKQQGG